MLGGVHHKNGLPGKPVWVTRLTGVSFLHVKAAEWGNPPNHGNQITRAWRVILTISPPKLPKLWWNSTVLATINVWNWIVKLISRIKLKFGLQQRHWNEKQLHWNKRLVLCLCACLATKWLHFGPHPATPGFHVKTSISLPCVGEVHHLAGVPHFHVNRPLVINNCY